MTISKAPKLAPSPSLEKHFGQESLALKATQERLKLRMNIDAITDKDLKAEAQKYIDQIKEEFDSHTGNLPAIDQVRLDNLVEVCVGPIKYKASQYSTQINEKNKSRLLPMFVKEAKQITKAQKAMVLDLVSEEGWLGAPTVERLNREAQQTATLLASDQNSTLREAYLAVNKDPKTVNIGQFAEALNWHFHDPKLQGVIWPIARRLSSNQKITILKRLQDSENFNEIIDQGNKKGVFSGAEISAVLEVPPKQLKAYSDTWEQYNRLRNQFYYDNGAKVEEMMTLGGLSRFALKTWGITTLSANFLATIASNPGELRKDPSKIVDRLAEIAKNEMAWLGLGTYIGVKAYEKDAPIFTHDNKEHQQNQQFAVLIGSKYYNQNWEKFMTSQDSDGMTALVNFKNYLKKQNDGDLPDINKISTRDFYEYLHQPDDALTEAAQNPKELPRLAAKFSKLSGKDRLGRYLHLLESHKIHNFAEYHDKKQKIKTIHA